MNKNKTFVVVAGVAIAVLACVIFRLHCASSQESADQKAAACLREYALVVGGGRSPVSAEQLKPILAEMEALSGACGTEVRNCLLGRRLDGAFLVGDYALAEKMMDELPGKSANWKEGAKAKVRAHAALERGDKAAAIREFEIFCQTLLREDPETVECDPCTDVVWSLDGLLAHNLKRMGELAAEIGDNDRAAKYRAEGRMYATKALQKAEGYEDGRKVFLDDFGSLVE